MIFIQQCPRIQVLPLQEKHSKLSHQFHQTGLREQNPADGSMQGVLLHVRR